MLKKKKKDLRSVVSSNQGWGGGVGPGGLAKRIHGYGGGGGGGVCISRLSGGPGGISKKGSRRSQIAKVGSQPVAGSPPVCERRSERGDRGKSSNQRSGSTTWKARWVVGGKKWVLYVREGRSVKEKNSSVSCNKKFTAKEGEVESSRRARNGNAGKELSPLGRRVYR